MDSSTVESDVEGEAEDEIETPGWFRQCCVSECIEDTKKEAVIKSTFKGYEAVVAHPSFLWEVGKEITYAYLGPHSGTPNQREIVAEAMKEWQRYANVKFRQIFNAQNAMIRISFDPKDGNWSRLGTYALRIHDTEPTMNICDVNEDTAPTPRQRGVVLHEIGHVLGLKHEHQSPSVAGILTWIDKEVKAYFKKKCRWSDTVTQAQVLTLEDPNQLTNYTHFDVKSIMLYPMPSSTNFTARSIGQTGVNIPSNDCLSVHDKAFIVIHYPYPARNPLNPQWSFERALREMGFSEYLNQNVIALYKKGDWRGIREALPEWYRPVRLIANAQVATSIE